MRLRSRLVPLMLATMMLSITVYRFVQARPALACALDPCCDEIDYCLGVAGCDGDCGGWDCEPGHEQSVFDECYEATAEDCP